MTDFHRVLKPDPEAATVHIFQVEHEAMAQITWPASDGSSSLIPKSVGRQLRASEALSMAEEALDLGTVEKIVVQIEDETLWDEAWGRIRWGGFG